MTTNEEDEESDSCIERGVLDNTEGDIISDLSKLK
jgi:hypothetical protein